MILETKLVKFEIASDVLEYPVSILIKTLIDWQTLNLYNFDLLF